MKVWGSRRPIDGHAEESSISPARRSVVPPEPSTPRRGADGSPRLMLRALILTAALLAVPLQCWQERMRLAALSIVMLAAALLLLARLMPFAGQRYRGVTPALSLAFALLIWTSPGTAAASALLSHLLLARFGPAGQTPRSLLRFQGAQLALAALATGDIGSLIFGGAHPFHLAGLTPHTSLALLANAMLLAAVFVISAVTLEAVSSGRPSRAAVVAYTGSLLPVVLFAPLGAVWGPIVGLPALLLLIMGARIVRLNEQVTALRGQLRAAEAMGRAGLSDDGTAAPSQLLERFLKLAQEIVRSERALIWTLDPETGDLSPAAALPDAGPFSRRTVHSGEGLIGHAALRNRPRLVPDAARDPHRGLHEAAEGAWMLYPIVVRGKTLGVAHWMRPANQPFALDDLTRIDALVPQAAIALENAAIRAQMHHLASTDGLTGLWNQRKMADILRAELRRAARYHRVFSVLMLDVDSFKTFNDTYGHPQGDHLLRSIAAILRSQVRSVDYVGRFGGEEFLILLPETTKDDACRLAERLRLAVEEHGCVTMEGAAVHRTISVGVASYPEDALNPTELLQRADEALYRAKRGGKNRVIWA